MDFSSILEFKNKKFWWMDVIFYFVVSLFIATIFCYVIFLLENTFLRKDIKNETEKLLTVGTDEQKRYEKDVIVYQGKINDFSDLFKSREFASNVFTFIQAQTRPNIWFKQFSLDAKNNVVQMSGESDDMDAFSRQVATFESEDNKKYIKSIGTLNSSLGGTVKTQFNINLALSPDIFSYVSNIQEVTSETSQESPLVPGSETSAQQNPQSPGETLSSENSITSFHLLLNPEVIGLLDQTNHIVTLNVPYGANIKNVATSITVSNRATVSPLSGVLQDFSNPVVYRVTAQDGSTQDYQVRAVVGAAPVSNKPSSIQTVLVIISVIIVIAAIIGTVLFILRKNKQTKYAS